MKTTLTIAAIILTALITPTQAVTALPDLVVPDGFGINIHFRNDPPDLDMIAAAGFKFIRMDFSWSAIEHTKGVYDFEKTGYDALTAGCLRRGIRPLYIFDYSNSLYEKDRSVQTEQGRKAFAAFAAAAAKHYAGKGILWEIWNEPNIRQFWVPQPSDQAYSALVAAAAPAIKAADPSALVLACTSSTIAFQWLENCFARGLLAHIDAVTVHPYRPANPETVIADYDRLRKLIAKYSPNRKIPIISGEWGYSNVNWDRTALTDNQQAQYLVRELLTNLYSKIPVSIWYDWKNDGTNPAEREHNFGIVENDLKPKTAFIAARTLTSTLAGYRITKRLPLDSDQDFAMQLSKGRTFAFALWTTGKNHKIALTMPAGRGTLVDMLGESKQITWNSPGPDLTVSQSPQYLLVNP